MCAWIYIERVEGRACCTVCCSVSCSVCCRMRCSVCVTVCEILLRRRAMSRAACVAVHVAACVAVHHAVCVAACVAAYDVLLCRRGISTAVCAAACVAVCVLQCMLQCVLRCVLQCVLQCVAGCDILLCRRAISRAEYPHIQQPSFRGESRSWSVTATLCIALHHAAIHCHTLHRTVTR